MTDLPIDTPVPFFYIGKNTTHTPGAGVFSMGMFDRAEILLVEDNPNDEELFKMALLRNHIHVKVDYCRNGEDAIDCVFGHGKYFGLRSRLPHKIIFLDIKLPGMDGLEVLKALKSDERTHDIPIIVFSSSDEEADVAKSLRLGANSYVVKPVQFDTYFHVARETILYWLTINRSRP